MGVVGLLDVVVGTEHGGGNRVIESSVHVDQLHAADLFVACKASVKHQVVGVLAVSPGVEMAFLLDVPLAIGDGGPAA